MSLRVLAMACHESLKKVPMLLPKLAIASQKTLPHQIISGPTSSDQNLARPS